MTQVQACSPLHACSDHMARAGALEQAPRQCAWRSAVGIHALRRGSALRFISGLPVFLNTGAVERERVVESWCGRVIAARVMLTACVW
jgi:hypothetical protein